MRQPDKIVTHKCSRIQHIAMPRLHLMPRLTSPSLHSVCQGFENWRLFLARAIFFPTGILCPDIH